MVPEPYAGRCAKSVTKRSPGEENCFRLITLKDIDLSAQSGKSYWRNGTLVGREGFVYFLFRNRFYDRIKRWPLNFSTRPPEFAEIHELHKCCGGTISSIISHRDCICNLGGTVRWLSPVFKTIRNLTMAVPQNVGSTMAARIIVPSHMRRFEAETFTHRILKNQNEKNKNH